MKIRAVGFDYGGVLAGTPGPQFVKKVTQILDIDIPVFESVYFEFNYLLNKNVLSLEDFWKKITAELNREEKYHKVMDFINSLSPHEVNKKMLDLVDKLRSSGYKVGLLSNNTLEVANRIREAGLAQHFDVMVVSSEVGYIKPDPQAFKIFIERLGVKPEELIYIDDVEKSLSSAGEVGFRPILYTDYEILLKTLESLGVIVS